jgi:hypothetical protein
MRLYPFQEGRGIKDGFWLSLTKVGKRYAMRVQFEQSVKYVIPESLELAFLLNASKEAPIKAQQDLRSQVALLYTEQERKWDTWVLCRK